eukprot:TRINITY_DN22906_c0_g1_i1.p1 TRINITY_DN22906_c0_g1~~TRINITY_DN22906_c0_g1_i1.p1  ORF type:complete len:393 (+),score=68.03 TRINITY_DN22906_c0_g1_i1:127-1305(+)
MLRLCALRAVNRLSAKVTLSRGPFPWSKCSFSSSGKGSDGGDDDAAWERSWTDSIPSQSQPPSVTPQDDQFSSPVWESAPSWSTDITEEHFQGDNSGSSSFDPSPKPDPAFEHEEEWNRLKDEYFQKKAFGSNIYDELKHDRVFMRQIECPGLRGEYLKDSDKQEMYRLHKENPEVYTVERLAKDFRVLRQRVHAILWLKEDEEEMEKRMGPLDDAVERLIDAAPEFFITSDKEFHVARLALRPKFRVMPEDWDGTIKDLDEKLWEISQKEDRRMYEDFVLRMQLNKAKMAGKVKCHPVSRARPPEGWSMTIEKLPERSRDKKEAGRRFVSLPDGSSRQLNDLEKLFLKTEKKQARREIRILNKKCPKREKIPRGPRKLKKLGYNSLFKSPH